MKMIENIRNTVGFIYSNNGDNYIPLGTGFFAWIQEENRTFKYLITCKHVVKPDIGVHPIYVRLSRSDMQETYYVPLENEWVFHKDAAVDLAVTAFPTPTIRCVFEAVDTCAVFFDNVLNYAVTEGEQVAFVGLFTKIQGKTKNTPIYRYGHVAMMPDGKLDGEFGHAEYYLVECTAYKGNSGSPLWIAIPTPTEEDPYRHTVFILGVMARIYLEAETEIPFMPGKIIHNSGISLAVPVKYVREVLMGDKLIEDRKRKIEEGKLPTDRPASIAARYSDSFDREDFSSTLKKASKPDLSDEESPTG
jgi:hypothetical protein